LIIADFGVAALHGQRLGCTGGSITWQCSSII
jgi:hypothetical protein